MNWIEVISVGPGDVALLTLAARQAIDRAQVVCCAERHRVLLPPGVNVIPMLPLEEALDALAAMREAGLRTAVLVSGDAGVYSLLNLLAQRFDRDVLRVHPGVSALQAFFAAMKRPWQEARVLSAHGRALSPSALCHAVRTSRETVLFLDEARDPHWVREVLTRGGLAHARMTVGERLSYADERVAAYEPERDYPSLCMAYVRNDAPESGLPPIGLSDESFCRGKTPMTKREIRVQALSALGLAQDSVVWDVGAGTGSVTVECARQCPLGEVFAIERNAQALELIAENVRRFHLLNVSVVPGEAPGALAGLKAPTHVFIGGSGASLNGVLDAVLALPGPVRIAATAVTMESAARLTERMQPLDDFTAVQLAAARLERVGGHTMLRAQSPVFLFAGTKGEKGP